MALRDQPYIPLYIQDIMTDEKLNECTAATHGIFIKGIMCLMHKSKTYGKILLKQKYKQIESKEESKEYAFACQLDKHLPYTKNEIFSAIQDLIREEVCYFENDFLCQKRMIKDNELSLKRAKAGKKGGDKSKQFAQAKKEANSENENKDDNIDVNNKKVEILNSLKWIEQICMKKFLNLNVVNDYLAIFLDDLELKDDLHKSVSEIKRHFINWLNLNLKELKKEKSSDKKEIRAKTFEEQFKHLM